MSAQLQVEMERRLLELSTDYPRTTDDALAGAPTALMLAARARSLYAGFVHALDGPSEPTIAVALRPLVETTIRLRWYSIDPVVNRPILDAVSAKSDKALLNDIKKHLGPFTPDQLQNINRQLDELAPLIEKGIEAAKDACRPYELPNLEQMVDDVVREIPGHKIAMRQSYVIAFRAVSPWVHAEVSSFRGTTEGVTPTVAQFLGDRVYLGVPILRLTAGSMMAYSIETASYFLRDANAMLEARFIRDSLVDAESQHRARAEQAAYPAWTKG